MFNKRVVNNQSQCYDNRYMSSLVTINKNILNGTPVVSGTRIPLERLEYLAKKGQLTITDLQEEYPHVETKKLHDVIAFLIQRGISTIEKEYKKTN